MLPKTHPKNYHMFLWFSEIAAYLLLSSVQNGQQIERCKKRLAVPGVFGISIGKVLII